jgi:hypothetical protein
VTSFSDDFNRADSTNLGANWVEVSGDWSIVSNQLSPGAAGGTIILRAAGAMASNDNYAQVTIAATTVASQGVWCRGNSNISQGYLWRNNGTSWDLFQVVGGSFTVIGTYTAAAAPGDVAKVQAVGTTIKGYVNGVQRVSVTDTAVTTGTSVGIRSDSAGAIRYDDFSAADVTAGATLGIASSTETAQPLTGTKTGTLAIATEVGAAQPLAGAKARALTFASAVESAQPLTGGEGGTRSPPQPPLRPRSPSRVRRPRLGTAAAPDTAQPVTGAKTTALGLAGASEAAQQLVGSKTAALGTATEADGAQAVAGAKTAALAPAVEQGAAQVLSGVKAATLGIAGSVEAAQPLTSTFPATLPTAGAVETARPLVGAKTATLTPALEVDTAHPLTVPSTTVPSPERTYMIPAELGASPSPPSTGTSPWPPRTAP